MLVRAHTPRRPARRGTIIPLLAIALVAVFGFVAFAVDVGMIAVARTQAQNAADAAAMTGARTLDGTPSGNVTAATTNAVTAATQNIILGRTIQSNEVTVVHGAYHYDDATEKFSPQIPPQPPNNYNLTRVTVTAANETAFARVFNINSFNVTATATAAHRPRDITIILDFSGSMNNESDLWNNEGYLGSANNSPNNPDPVVPRFGHYSSSNAQMYTTSTDPRVGKSNVTQTVLGIAPLVNDFYQHSRGSGSVAAFTPAPNSYDTTPEGDNYLYQNGSTTTYAQTIQQITGGATFLGYQQPPFSGYSGPAVPPFAGYTRGPKYYGKTFFIWPPDPYAGNPSYPESLTADPPRDWRRKFFLKPGGSYPTFGGPVDDNRCLWDGNGSAGSGGNWRNPIGTSSNPATGSTTNYIINYRAILHWIKNTGPNPFPPMLRAGRVLYYDAIPDDVPPEAYNYANRNDQIPWANQNQRFWKEYIDYTLGVWRNPSSSSATNGISIPGTPACSYGPDFTWGTVQISAKPTNGTYMNYNDNPRRPRHRFWFGPMTMIQFISDTGLLPGTAHDISMYPAKLGISAAIDDIKNNHPNDLVSLILFNRPRFNGEAPERGRFSQVQMSLSRDYAALQDALWFPPNSKTADVRPWDPDGLQTPRSGADYQANTCSNYGFMLAYNQFSANATLRSSSVGGMGRKGSQRLIIFETDGMTNIAAIANFVQDGKNSYYQIGPTDSVTASGSAESETYAVVDRLVALETDNVNGPGFAKPGRPVIIHCIAFGAIFEPTASGTEKDNAIRLLQTISAKGGTYFPSSLSDTSNGDQRYKFCIGTLDERREKLRQAFRRITDSGTTPALIE
jgi:Flp pilus assembly protein TadG